MKGGYTSTWRLTWPVLPLIFIATMAILDIGILPRWTASIDRDTGSLAALTAMEHRTELGASPEIGRWWIGVGTPEAQMERWQVLIAKLDWSVRRVIGILLVLGLALMAPWPWHFKADGVQRRSPWLVIVCCVGLGVAAVSVAHGMHYLLYGEFIYLGDYTEEHRTLLYGDFSMWIDFYSGLVLAPIVEEILFRGWLQRILTPICKIWPTLIVQAVLFGAIHYPEQGFNGFLMTGVIGFLLGLVFLYSGKLWPCILCHSLLNLFGSSEDIWWICTGRPE